MHSTIHSAGLKEFDRHLYKFDAELVMVWTMINHSNVYQSNDNSVRLYWSSWTGMTNSQVIFQGLVFMAVVNMKSDAEDEIFKATC